jgi:hypothetical protein
MLRRPVPGSNQGQRVQGPRRKHVVAQRGRFLPGSSLAHSLLMEQEYMKKTRFFCDRWLPTFPSSLYSP